MFATGVTMGLVEWIIDDTCLVETLVLTECSNLSQSILNLDIKLIRKHYTSKEIQISDIV